MTSIQYCVSLESRQAHLYRVRLSIEQPAAEQTLSLPVWIPGSYLVREFSKNLHRIRATQDGQSCRAEQINKNTWRVNCHPDHPLVLEYLVSAYEASVRGAWLDTQRGFFNGTSLFLRVWGQEHLPHQLRIENSADELEEWQLATALQPVQVNEAGFGLYEAANYDELVDSPVEMGKFWSASFTACGVPHRFVVSGAAPSFDGERLIEDTRKICEAQIRFWHPDVETGEMPEHDRYVFLLNATHDGYGGLEHCHSTALICKRADLPRKGQDKASEGYIGLMGLISHEYFHTWNVKRLRPKALLPYEYDRENYTELLWFFEGITSYYDDLILQRSGLITSAGYLKILAKTIMQVRQTPGRNVQSLAESSFDAWVKYYRQDAHTINHTVSYYAKGALLGLCLDLTLRRAGSSLDALMRLLWERARNTGLDEQIFKSAFLDLCDSCDPRDFDNVDSWIHGREDLPLQELLEEFGIAWQEPLSKHPFSAEALGLRVQERGKAPVMVRQVLTGGCAEQAGMMPGDLWYGVEISDKHTSNFSGWRISSLEDLELYIAQDGGDTDAQIAQITRITALIERDGRLLRLPIEIPTRPISAGIHLHVQDASAAQRWLTCAFDFNVNFNLKGD